MPPCPPSRSCLGNRATWPRNSLPDSQAAIRIVGEAPWLPLPELVPAWLTLGRRQGDRAARDSATAGSSHDGSSADEVPCMLCHLLQAAWARGLTDHTLGGRPDLTPISSLATALARKFLAFPGSRLSAFPTLCIRHLTEFQNHSHEGNFKENTTQPDRKSVV